MGTEIGSFKKIRDQNKIPWTIFANRSSRTCKTLSSLCGLHHTIESHILVSLQLQCTRNGKRTIQLPELNPGPAGPETHLEYQTNVEALGERSTTRCFFFFLFSARLFNINLPSVDTGISHPLFLATLKILH